ncbi:MAG: four helix bundle protein [Candidatus Harrisonbacteria bacterium CG10_big_fil_rev_8_21_14_0_10_49_15]|uniref:Four helix bundle protein n=1 Tax=Candidatus Harrisonbacteria bacterium CG10_big_fil_rev_8_21_14_0_10_49_15 TaxID=1974587 RepID=A0A2H0UKI9_9BACT|nr:MAG: four helix bundle protein [Candidatus Harrisonbacteria bacterium CG10_big_fil_rev_8_21_14_0_10_49_15]
MEKQYDLEERTLQFAIDVRKFIAKLPKNSQNIEDGKQVIRSSGSIGANYIEANESLSKKDFVLRIKISRKEAKETIYWVRIILAVNGPDFTDECRDLLNEATELKKILSAILNKSS